MKLENVAAIVDDNVATITATIGQTPFGNGNTYTFKTTKALAAAVEQGDLMLADVRGEITIISVVKVDEDLEIDPDANFEYRWAFQKVYVARLSALQERTRVLADKLRGMKRKSVRDQVLASLGIDNVKALLTDGEELPE